MLRIGTRKSPLALWQAEHVQSLLAARGHESELVRITTEGDRVLDRSLAQIGGKGLFIKELEEAIAAGRADLAVHSAKDVPYALPEGFALAAFPEREDARDALIAPQAKTFAQLPRGARVGTSSLRRAVQLVSVRPDLEILAVRGNVQTRLSRAGVERDGVHLDAVVLALAGLRRLGLEQHITEVLPIELSLPAAGQGAIAIEALRGSPGFAASVELDDAATARCVQAERAVLQALAGSCTVPIAAYAVEDAGALWLRAALGGPDGEGKVRLLRAEGRGAEPGLLGASVAEQLLALGAGPLLAAARSAPGLPPPKR
jgi:hydroxymethylbilane synthase